jgi:hypothetical protein
MPVKKFFTLNEAVAAILDDSESENGYYSDDSENRKDPEICILPPNDGAESELEGVDEDDLEPDEPPDVCGQVS